MGGQWPHHFDESVVSGHGAGGQIGRTPGRRKGGREEGWPRIFGWEDDGLRRRLNERARRSSTAWHALPPSPLHARTLAAHCAPAREPQEHERPSEQASGRAESDTSPIFIRRSYVVNSWDGRTDGEGGNAMEEEKQAASAKTFKLSEGRNEEQKLPKTRTYYTYVLAVVPFPP